ELDAGLAHATGTNDERAAEPALRPVRPAFGQVRPTLGSIALARIRLGRCAFRGVRIIALRAFRLTGASLRSFGPLLCEAHAHRGLNRLIDVVRDDVELALVSAV